MFKKYIYNIIYNIWTVYAYWAIILTLINSIIVHTVDEILLLWYFSTGDYLILWVMVNPFVSGFFLIHRLPGVGVILTKMWCCKKIANNCYDMLLSTIMLNIHIIFTYMLSLHVYVHVSVVCVTLSLMPHRLTIMASVNPSYIRRHFLPD